MTNKQIHRIAINTGGGDAPGLNAVIRAAVLSAERRDWEVLGIHHGYAGLLDTSKIMTLDHGTVRGITHLGGTILGTANKGNPFEMPMKLPDGSETVVNRSILETIHRSLVTQLAAMFVMVALLLFGGASIKHFIGVLFVGLLSGTYSSIFTAVPLLVEWEGRASTA